MLRSFHRRAVQGYSSFAPPFRISPAILRFPMRLIGRVQPQSRRHFSSYTHARRREDVDSTYQRLSPIEHVLLRPGMYVGSVGSHCAPVWTSDATQPGEQLVFARVKYVPALVKLFDEILVNSLDNRTRDSKGTTGLDIRIELKGKRSPRLIISILNNGQGLPVVHHKKEGMWVPELVFGHLMTGSNFSGAPGNQRKVGSGQSKEESKASISNEEEHLSTGGQHGLGAKLANILSTRFSVETYDAKAGLLFRQHWARNMRDAGSAEVSKPAPADLKGQRGGPTLAGGFTRIEFEPDLGRFDLVAHAQQGRAEAATAGGGGLTPQQEAMEALQGSVQVMRRRALDAAAVSGLTVRFNGGALGVRSVEAYAEAMRVGGAAGGEGAGSGVVRWSPSKRFTAVVRALSREERAALAAPVGLHGLQGREGPLRASFVNGMRTDGGGLHVSGLLEPLARQCAALAARELGRAGAAAGSVTPSLVKSYLQVVVSAQVRQPQFDSQSKDHLVGGDVYVGRRGPPERLAREVLDAGLMQVLREEAFSREEAAAARDARKLRLEAKRFKAMDVPKLEDANWAGTRRAPECTLIVTEGDSAKALAVAGLAAVGRDRYGVFPLRGKLLNVRGMRPQQALKNEEISNLVKILGLDPSCSYLPGAARTQVAKQGLRYGRLMIMADQDTDGSHIKGLVMNVFHSLFPGLVQRGAESKGEAASDGEDGFLQLFITPVVKARSRKGPPQELEFFSVHGFQRWAREEGADLSRWRIKYYKGLGTSTAAEGRRYFGDLARHRVDLRWDGDRDADRLSLAFAKDRAADRKEWLLGHGGAWTAGGDDEAAGAEGREQASDPGERSWTSYGRFVDDELVHFSLADVRRSIPSAVDGLKPSQRKVLFACFKRQGSFAGKDGSASSPGQGAASDLKRRLAGWLGAPQGEAGGSDSLPTAEDLRLLRDPDPEMLAGPVAVAGEDAGRLAGLIAGLRRGAKEQGPAISSDDQEELKVSQLAGFVGEQSAYHHGEASLTGTIVGMAQSFVGANNVPLLLPLGQFGTRLQGGKDAASPRYVYTRLSPMARLLLPRADDALLDRVTDDGERVEPRHFCPVAPTVLMNGAEGIGTGWSTQVPQFHPVDVVDAMLSRVRAGAGAGAGEEDWALQPWYRGFGGEIEVQRGEGSGAVALVSLGRARVLPASEAKKAGLLKRGASATGDSQWVEVQELPLKRWTDDFKKLLHRLTTAGQVEDVREHHTETAVRFLVRLAEGADLSRPAVDRLLKLSARASAANMHLIAGGGMIRLFPSPEAVLHEHAEARMQLYRRRLEVAAEALSAEAVRSQQEAAFVDAVSSGQLQLTGVPMDQVVQRLHEQEMAAGGGNRGSGGDTPGEMDAPALRRRYEHLLRLPLASLTAENSVRIRERAEYAGTTAAVVQRLRPEVLWEAELLDARAGLMVWCGGAGAGADA